MTINPAGVPRTLRWTRYSLLAVVGITIFFVIKLQPSSVGAFVFLVAWLAAPHGALALLLHFLNRRGKPILPWCGTSLLVAAAGVLILTDVIYWHPDPQSAIGVVLTPILQAIAFGIVAPFAAWTAHRMRP